MIVTTSQILEAERLLSEGQHYEALLQLSLALQSGAQRVEVLKSGRSNLVRLFRAIMDIEGPPVVESFLQLVALFAQDGGECLEIFKLVDIVSYLGQILTAHDPLAPCVCDACSVLYWLSKNETMVATIRANRYIVGRLLELSGVPNLSANTLQMLTYLQPLYSGRRQNSALFESVIDPETVLASSLHKHSASMIATTTSPVLFRSKVDSLTAPPVNAEQTAEPVDPYSLLRTDDL